jgi:hypothetical protein
MSSSALSGASYPLVQALLQPNKHAAINEALLVEVVVMSRNSPETGLRILNNIREYEIPITRNPFTGGLARLSRSVGPVSIGNGRAGDSSDCTLVAPNIDYAMCTIWQRW